MKQNKKYSPSDIVAYNMSIGRQMESYTNKNIIRSILGITLVAYGISTILLPTGSIIALIVGCSILGYDFGKIIQRAKYEMNLKKLGLIAKWKG